MNSQTKSVLVLEEEEEVGWKKRKPQLRRTPRYSIAEGWYKKFSSLLCDVLATSDQQRKNKCKRKRKKKRGRLQFAHEPPRCESYVVGILETYNGLFRMM